MREGTAKEIKFESIDNLFGIPNESKQHVTTMIPLESLIHTHSTHFVCLMMRKWTNWSRVFGQMVF